MGGGGPKCSGELETQVRVEVTREGPTSRAAAPGRQGLGTAILPRLSHHTPSPFPPMRTLLQTRLTPLNDLTWAQTPPRPLPRCATLGRSPTLLEPQFHPEAPTTWGGVDPRTHGRPGPAHHGRGWVPGPGRADRLRRVSRLSRDHARRGRVPTLCRPDPWDTN